MYIFAAVPFVGTWIEILLLCTASGPEVAVPFVGTWIEIPGLLHSPLNFFRRTLRGYVDWNHSLEHSEELELRRTLRGYVDWNFCTRCASPSWSAVPFVGTWIEIPPYSWNSESISAVPFVGTWIEIAGILKKSRYQLCRTLRGYVDWNWYCCQKSAIICQMPYPSWVRGLKYD